MMLVEETTVPSTALPVAAFKDHLRLGSGFADDGLQTGVLESFLRAALAAIEARTGKILIRRDFRLTLSHWRDDEVQPLPVAPVSAILEVSVITQTGSESLSPVTAWRLVSDTHRPGLGANTGSLPTIPANGTARVRFTAGFGPNWFDLPADMAQAVMMLAAHYYEFRNDAASSAGSMPYGVTTLIDRYRTVRLFLGGGRK